MKDQVMQTVQEAASSKTALAIGLGTASVPAWVDIINSEMTQAIAIVIGMIVSVTIILVNVQTFRVRTAEAKVRARQENLRLRLLEEQAKERGIDL